MSTEIIIFGQSVAESTIFNLTGLFGGLFPFFYDLLNRQKQPAQEKIELNAEFFVIKALLTPLLAMGITVLAVAFGNITSWLAALYLGASLPVLLEKVLGSSQSTVSNLEAGQ